MLLVAPPGGGKTCRVLARFRGALASGREPLLIVPTASMAEHLRHQLAREGLVFPPDAIQPLDAFVEDLTPESRELSAAAQTLLLERALAAVPDAGFGSVVQYPGFQARLLDTVHEFWSAGVDAREAAALLAADAGFTRVMAAFETLLERAGAVHRSARLRLAAEALRRRTLDLVLFDGFPNFTPVELHLVCAAADASRESLVTLPHAGAGDARRALVERGFAETVLSQVLRPQPEPLVVAAPSPEAEIEDIAGRILADRAASGRPFREYGLILRDPDLYVPLVAAVFERLGLPFRASAAPPLAEHAAVRYLAGLLQAAADGFDALQTLELMKLGGSGLASHPDLDRYDFLLREKAPGAGVLFLLQLAENFPRVKQFVARLEDLSRWSHERLPPHEWAQRCAALPAGWFSLPAIADRVDHAAALEWRTLAAALEGFRRAAAETALLLDGPSDLAGWLRAFGAVLRLTPLRIPDRRRDVVQVLSVYEARQWELPVVFVCGLVERGFPRHHQQNLFFGDGRRQGLALLGLRLRTTEDLDAEERLLFDTARSRATRQLYLTYPEHSEDGGDTLPSFFLEPWADQVRPAAAVRLHETPPVWAPAPGWLRPESRDGLHRCHQQFSPSSLERYIQCPFQFFAAHTLGLKGPPPAPEERIDDLLRGLIIHRTIALWAAAGSGDIGPVFDRVFLETCARAGIRLNFHAEALEIQLRADLERFARFERERRPSGLAPGPPEHEITYTVEHEGAGGPFRITGRIDRYDVSAANAAVVVDYKYSTAQRLRALCREQEQGWRVQAPLYLLGLERERGLRPAGMVLYGLREEPSREGWYARGLLPEDHDLAALDPQEFRAMLDAAETRAGEIVRDIRAGCVEVKPRDSGFCREYCRYWATCRVDV